MGTRLLILHLPCSSSPALKPYGHLRTFRAERRRATNGHSNSRGPTSTGPGFGFDPEDDFEWAGGGRSASSSKRRTWWVDQDDDDADGYSVWDSLDNEEEEDAEFPFFKVVKAFGWMLPAIGLSLLMGTGPNAFFMALAVPLGQTALSLVFDKVWGRASGNVRGRRRNKASKKPFRRASYATKRSGTDIKDKTKTGQQTGSYQSWMGAAGNGSYKKSDSKGRHQYGGWDELDGGSQGQRAPGGMPKDDTGSTQTQMRRSKLSRPGRVRERPLLIRLMIAVFPFLGSWTRFIS